MTAGIRARPIASLGLHYPIHFTPTKSAAAPDGGRLVSFERRPRI